MSHEEGEKLVNECLVEFKKLGQQIRNILANDNDSQSDEKEKRKMKQIDNRTNVRYNNPRFATQGYYFVAFYFPLSVTEQKKEMIQI